MQSTQSVTTQSTNVVYSFVRAKQAGSVFDAPRHRPQPTHTQAELLRLAVYGPGSGPMAGCEVIGAKPSAKHVAPVVEESAYAGACVEPNLVR